MKERLGKKRIIVKEKGITLIALVITIIVLLILAGVTIATLAGNNGIITRASQAAEETRIAQVEEQVNLWKSEKEMGNTTGGTITSEDNFLQNLKDNGSVTEDEIDRTNQIIKIGDTEIYYGSGSELTDIYVALYTDGTLVFNSKDEFDESLLSKNYGKIDVFGTNQSPPWNSDKDSITTANFLNKVVPKSTRSWFNTLEKLTTIQNIANLDTSRVTDMSFMFYRCFDLQTVDLTHFNTENVTNMEQMFSNCGDINNLDFSSFNTSKVTHMDHMFHACTNLTQLDLSSFNTGEVTDMAYMFSRNRNLTTLNLSSFDTSKVANMACMFSDCKKLTELNLSSFDTKKVDNYFCMFGLNNDLLPATVTIYIGPNWNSEMTEIATNYAGKFIKIE